MLSGYGCAMEMAIVFSTVWVGFWNAPLIDQAFQIASKPYRFHCCVDRVRFGATGRLTDAIWWIIGRFDLRRPRSDRQIAFEKMPQSCSRNARRFHPEDFCTDRAPKLFSAATGKFKHTKLELRNCR